jgi:hypothetical protein
MTKAEKQKEEEMVRPRARARVWPKARNPAVATPAAAGAPSLSLRRLSVLCSAPGARHHHRLTVLVCCAEP